MKLEVQIEYTHTLQLSVNLPIIYFSIVRVYKVI